MSEPTAESSLVCQLRETVPVARPLTTPERMFLALRRTWALNSLRAAKAIRDPGWALRRTWERARSRGRSEAVEGEHMAPNGAGAPLRLKAGERVRVRAAAEIRAMLADDGTYERMAYLPVVMDRYCGREFTVRGRVDRFFDERHWRMLRLTNTVILEGAFCEPEEHVQCEYAGCQRSCFLFWKEGWLERVEDPR